MKESYSKLHDKAIAKVIGELHKTNLNRPNMIGSELYKAVDILASFDNGSVTNFMVENALRAMQIRSAPSDPCSIIEVNIFQHKDEPAALCYFRIKIFSTDVNGVPSGRQYDSHKPAEPLNEVTVENPKNFDAADALSKSLGAAAAKRANASIVSKLSRPTPVADTWADILDGADFFKDGLEDAYDDKFDDDPFA